MSFDLSTAYERALLRPLVLPPTDTNATNESANLSKESQWRSSTHIFQGTDDRDETAAWPPAKFDDNPSKIPNDEAYNIPYDPASKKANSSEFKLYSDSEQNKTSNVPPPKLVAKRYIPRDQVNKSEQGVTLLTLTGMGVPKKMFEPIFEDLTQTQSSLPNLPSNTPAQPSQTPVQHTPSDPAKMTKTNIYSPRLHAHSHLTIDQA